jgi:hypothetical protein
MIANVNWQYILLQASNGVFRVKKRNTGPTILASETDMWKKDYWSKSAPPILSQDNKDYSFAFWSLIANELSSGQVAAQIQGLTQANASYSGGVWTISAKAYFVQCGSGPGGPAVLIDAFNIQSGDFIAEDFVEIEPDPGKQLSVAANNGYINTVAQIAPGKSITISAKQNGLDRPPIPPPGKTIVCTGMEFSSWQPIVMNANGAGSPPAIHDRDIVVHHGDSVLAFAFYNEEKQSVSGPGMPDAYDRWWWLETHGGRTPPGPQPVWMREFYAAALLTGAAGKISRHLRAGVLEVVEQQLAAVSSAMKKEIMNES